MPSNLSSQSKQLWVLYDSHCGLCQRAKLLLERLDVYKHLSFLPLDTPGLETRFTGLPSLEQRLQGMTSVSQDTGEVAQGVDAIAAILQRLPWPASWLAASLRWRLTKPLAERCYQWLASNRHKWLPPLPQDADPHLCQNENQCSIYRS